MTDWLPAEQAPRDGSIIYLKGGDFGFGRADPDATNPVCVKAKWRRSYGREDLLPEGWYFGDFEKGPLLHYRDPTHFKLVAPGVAKEPD